MTATQPRPWGLRLLTVSLIAGTLTVIASPAGAEEPIRDSHVAASDLGKDCSKTAEQIRNGLTTMGSTDKVTTVRHRGDFNATTPENSIEAFHNSYRACRPGIETDIRKTQDGEFVLFHDTNIGKMLEPSYNPEKDTGPNQRLDSLTYAQLRQKRLVTIERKPTDQKIVNLDTFLRDYVAVKGRSMIYLEIKADSDVLAVIKEFNEINLKIGGVDLYRRTIFKFRMTAYPTQSQFSQELSNAGIDESRVMVMPVMSAQISQNLDRLPPIIPGKKNSYTAVASWSSAPGKFVPSVEVVMKDAQGYQEYQYDFQYYRETESYLDMLPITVPTRAAFNNTRGGTMAEMSELVKSKNKPLAQFLPIPDWVMWRKNIKWDTPLNNTVPNTPTISPREAYFNNDSRCCYTLSDRLSGDTVDQEKADQRIMLPFQEKIKATVLTADDTDSIDAYFKAKGKHLDLGDNTRNPNEPKAEMNSLIYPGDRIPRAAVAQTTNIIKGINQIINKQYRTCVNNKNGSVTSQNPVINWKCDTGDPMNRWELRERDTGGYGLIALNGGQYCLNSQGRLGSVDIWPCDKPTNAMWRFRSDGSIVDKTTKGCLTLSGYQLGSTVETSVCDGSSQQQWLTDYAENSWGNVGGGIPRLLSYDRTQECLTLDNPSGKEYTTIWVMTCAGGPKRQWTAWTSMVNGQVGYMPVLESNIKDKSEYFYMCARSGGSNFPVKGFSCRNRSSWTYQWYYTPEREIVSVDDGQCLQKGAGGNAITNSCRSAVPDTWTWK